MFSLFGHPAPSRAAPQHREKSKKTEEKAKNRLEAAVRCRRNGEPRGGRSRRLYDEANSNGAAARPHSHGRSTSSPASQRRRAGEGRRAAAAGTKRRRHRQQQPPCLPPAANSGRGARIDAL
ncbi:hypothetical protein L596_023953 [Steinernema carpocapsae]|uniref:Uncharacterized protein n=1 Tax=Steinernema carpocapsae TaxID=34508 RepID=A0A4U5MF95_STECR|nr:hypothetical protein L596_023953 [Steinernema carpocapsae]